MNYHCLQKQLYSLGSYQLVPLRHEDIFSIMQWRNDQMDILRQKAPLTRDDQENYYHTVIGPSFHEKHPKQILFSYLLDGVCIGYGGLVHIDWQAKRAEVSFLIDTTRADASKTYQQDFTTFLRLIKNVAFEDLHFHRLFTETFDRRSAHVAILEKEGFKLEGRLKDHVLINGKYIDSLIHGCVHNE